jgi:hypothetical protein
MVEFMQRRTAVTSEVYECCETLRELRRTIQNQRLISGAALLHDNARPRTSTATCTQALLEYFSWELFDHPPYTPG